MTFFKAKIFAAARLIVERHTDSPGLRGIQHDIGFLLGALNLELSTSSTEYEDTELDRETVERIMSASKHADAFVPENVRHMYV